MDENILKCITFDQDCFCDMRMIVADQRQRMWKNEYLAELSEKSRCETLYSRKGIPPQVSRNVIISSYDYDILRQLWISNLLLLGSSQDGLYLEKGFPVFGFKKHSGVNETDLDILFEYSGVKIKQELPETLISTDTFLSIEKTSFEGYVKLRIVSPAIKVNSTPVYFSNKAMKQRLFFHLDESSFHVRTKYEYEVINESPAIGGNIQDELGIYDLDYVVAITMEDWPKLAETFITRDRSSGWPGPDILTDIVSKGCRFVATAHNSCKKDNYQWRVSFAASELILSRSLNNSQIRAFLFFKTIFQVFLQEPKCLSSYMMKNVLFWVVEMLPSNIWHADNILHCLKSLVDMLCSFLDRQIIPNFFLPNQNLIGHIKRSLVEELAKKAHDIQNDTLGMVIKCTEVSLFQGRCDISLNLMHSKLLTESDESNIFISMACFSSYLYLRLQAIRYKFQLPTDTAEECFTRGCRSICAAIPPRSVWYFLKALQIQPMESLRLYRRHDTWEFDISGMRRQVVQFWRSPVYTGIFKNVLSDQEYVTNEHVDTIPEFDLFVDWVDLTCLWSGFVGIKHGHLQCIITVD